MPALPHPLAVRPLRRLAALLPTLVLVGACAAPSGTPAPGPETTPSAAASARAALDAAVGEARCRADAECRTLPAGARPCGGPSVWVAYADAPGQRERLQPLAQALARAEQADHAASGRMSICQVLPDPGARCEAGRCVARPAGPGAALGPGAPM